MHLKRPVFPVNRIMQAHSEPAKSYMVTLKAAVQTVNSGVNVVIAVSEKAKCTMSEWHSACLRLESSEIVSPIVPSFVILFSIMFTFMQPLRCHECCQYQIESDPATVVFRHCHAISVIQEPK